MATCQYAIFEVVYQLDIQALAFLKSVAYGDYDWTQPTALEVLIRLSVDGKLPNNIIREIDIQLADMRYETHLYLAQGLLIRAKRDNRFEEILQQLKNEDFQEAVTEILSNKQ
ncbi:MAG: hypothetical protein J7623_15035 [Chitinophaga sp.]|uniref:hypothetical protein n=1 Tax=Chitinophaga sp. TaxID=1869181 RepID=UPI001B20FFBA|nr:hypothetical protein [Chitinophaga sp.]MBO9729950.1 hypothetical protein [Chitinophaga sp.]